MKRFLTAVAVLLIIPAIILVVEACGRSTAQAETPKRFVALVDQYYPSVILMQDTATGICWITTQRTEAGWTQVPKEVCEVKTGGR